jgi:hypothetical protein
MATTGSKTSRGAARCTAAPARITHRDGDGDDYGDLGSWGDDGENDFERSYLYIHTWV